MNKKMKRIFSLVLVVICVLNTMFMAYADNNNNAQIPIIDKNGDEFTITLEETSTSRMTKLYDKNGVLIQTITFDKLTGTLTNVDTGYSLSFSPDVIPNKCQLRSGNDYEYEFCTLGDTYTNTKTVTYEEIVRMVGVTAAAPNIAAALIALAGYGGTALAKAEIAKAAKKISQAIALGSALDDVVTLNFTYKCTEQWESDPSYPNGGFYFLGYLVSDFSFQL